MYTIVFHEQIVITLIPFRVKVPFGEFEEETATSRGYISDRQCLLLSLPLQSLPLNYSSQ